MPIAGYYLHMVARVAPGLSVEQASARLDELSRRMALQHDGSPRERVGWKFFLLPMARDDDGSVRRWMTILFAAVTGLLMVVCANVAGLLLVRATERQFDFSLRMALGASRFRIARQALTEVLAAGDCRRSGRIVGREGRPCVRWRNMALPGRPSSIRRCFGLAPD